MTENTGLARLLEALEANDWSNGEPNNDDLDSDSDLDSILDTIENPEIGSGTAQSHDPDLRIGLLEGQQTSKAATYGQGEGDEEEGGADAQVQELEAMMLKMQAVRGKPRSHPLVSPSFTFSFSLANILCRKPDQRISICSHVYIQTLLHSFNL